MSHSASTGPSSGPSSHVGGATSVRIRLHGELDITSRDATYRACTSIPAAHVVVDLADVTFLDSAGSLAFFRARDRLARDGGSLELTGAQGEPAQLLELLEMIGVESIADIDAEYRSFG